MIRSTRRYDVEVRERTLYGETTFGVVSRFLYTDNEGQDWVRVDGEWHPVDDRYAEPHVFVHELPNDILMEAA